MKIIRSVIIFILAIFLWKAGFSQDSVELLKYPEFIDITLENGLWILVAEHHEQPAVFYIMSVKAGVRDEPAGKEGLAGITASLLNQGTISRTGEEIARTIDGIGGYLSASAEVEYTTIGCTVLAEDVDTGLDLFSSIILEPVFPKKDFKRHKKQIISEIKQSYTDPSFIARKHALHMLFGAKSRFGRERTERNIKKIKVEDVKIFIKIIFFLITQYFWS